MKTLNRTLLCFLMLAFLMPVDGFAQKHRGKGRTKKTKTEAVVKEQKQVSAPVVDDSKKNKNKAVEHNDNRDVENNNFIKVVDDDDSNYVPSEEHNSALDGFLNAYNNNGNTQAANNEIESYFSSLSDSQKKSFNASVLDRIAPTLENNQYAASLALINLYQEHSSKNNKMMPMLYYIKGNIYVTLRDTTGLKQSIDALSRYRETEDYLELLSQNLNSIRSYKPDLKDLEGYWVASIFNKDALFVEDESACSYYNSYDRRYNNPYLILHNVVLNDSIQFKMMKKSHVADAITFGSLIEFRSPSRKDWHSQIVVPYSQDSIYVAWCNENLSKKSGFVASLLRTGVSMTADHLSGKLNMRHENSATTRALAPLATMAVEIGVNALIDAFFTPSKRLFFMDARLKMLNSHVMEGKVLFRNQKVKGDMINKSDEDYYNIRLYKWDDPNIVFEDREGFKSGNPILHEEIDEKAFKKDKSTNFAKYLIFSGNDSPDYNFEQIRQIIYNDYCILKNKGLNVDSIFPKYIKKPSMGIECFSVTPEIVKKRKLKCNEGVIVLKDKEKMIKQKVLLGTIYYDGKKIAAPACLYGIKKYDVITSINGLKIRNAEEAISILEDLKPAEVVKVVVNRSGTEIGFSFPFSYYYKIQPQRSNFLGFEYELIKEDKQGTKNRRAKVKNVEKDTPAKEAKLEKNDVILSINGQSFNDERGIQDLLNQNLNEPINLKVLRNNQEINITITPITLYVL